VESVTAEERECDDLAIDGLVLNADGLITTIA
jgi:hypothetical protein